MKHSKLTKSIVAVATIAALVYLPAVNVAADTVKTDTGTDGKSFIVRPYVWALGFKGDVGVGDYRTGVDVPFSDVLDALELGAILQLEGRSGRWGIIVDGVVVKLSEEKPTPGPFFSVVEPTVTMGALDASLAYRVLDVERGWLDILLGARYVKIDVELDLSPDYDAVDAISHKVVSQAASAIRDEVEAELYGHADEIAETLAANVGDIADQAKDLVREEVGNRVRERIGDILDEIGDRTPGPRGTDVSPSRDREEVIGDIKAKIRDRLEERLQDVKDEIRDAIAEEVKTRINDKLAEVAGKKDLIKKEIQRAAQEKIADLKRNASAAVRKELEKAEKELSALIEEGMNKAANKDINKDREWVDPYVGFRARVKLTDKIYLGGRGDIGGFGIGSDLTWQAFGGLGYAITDSILIEGGWRHLDIDYDHDDFIFDMAFSGAIFGVEISF
jgi:hypothetical protein